MIFLGLDNDTSLALPTPAIPPAADADARTRHAVPVVVGVGRAKPTPLAGLGPRLEALQVAMAATRLQMGRGEGGTRNQRSNNQPMVGGRQEG